MGTLQVIGQQTYRSLKAVLNKKRGGLLKDNHAGVGGMQIGPWKCCVLPKGRRYMAEGAVTDKHNGLAVAMQKP